MQQGPSETDAVVAELLERLAAITDSAEACSIVLERAAVISGVGRALIAMRGERGLTGCGRGVDQQKVDRILTHADETGAAVVDAIAQLKAPVVRRADWTPELGFAHCFIIPFPGVDSDNNHGVVVLDAPAHTTAIDIAVDVIRRCGPSLGRVLQIESLSDRVLLSNRERDLLTTMLNALPDPVLANQRAEELMTLEADNSEGRRRAVQVNHLRFSSENERLARELQQLNEHLEGRIRDATLELEERNSRLEWQSYELQKASRLKSEFLANMSHELRTPINVIVGYTSLMRERIYGDLTPQQDEALVKTYSTSQHLLELINDILDLSKIEAGKMPLHLELVSVQEIVAELSESVLPMVRRKELTFEAIVENGMPAISTDRTKLKQVLLNLLSNAIKFTHDGCVTVRVTMAGPRVVRFSVEDTGIGIRPENLNAIFDDFRQVDQSHTKEYGGTGLGLSITKKLLTLMHGSIIVESTWGEGTRFIVELPSISL